MNKTEQSTKLVTTVQANGLTVNTVVAVDAKGQPIGGTHAGDKSKTENTCKPAHHVSKYVRRRDAKLAKRVAAWEDTQKRNPKHAQHRPGSGK